MKYILLFTIVFLPVGVRAQAPGTYSELITLLIGFLPELVLIIGALIVLYFAWRIATFILVAGGKENREKAKRLFLWGILALFIALSLYGILSFILGELGFGQVAIPQLFEDVPAVDSSVNFD